MNDSQILDAILRSTGRRRRWLNAWRGMWNGLVAATVLWLLSVGAYKLIPVPIETVAVAAGVGAWLILGSSLVAWLRKPTLLETARWVDQQRHLQERLSTALEVAGGKQPPNEWGHLLLADAARSARQVDPKALLPLRLPPIGRWLVPLLLVAAGIGLLPEYRTKAHIAREKDKQIIQETGRQLAELTRRNMQQRPPALEPIRQSLDSVAELGDHLAKASLTRSEALKDLASATEKLREQARELGKSPAFKTLERAARTSSKGGQAVSEALQKQIESLQKTLGNESADSEAIEKLKEGVQQAKEAAAQLTGLDSNAREAAQEKLAEALANLSNEAKELGLSLPSLDEAISALAASQVEQLMRDLNIAEIDLEKLQAMAKTLEKLQAQMETLGKNLKEQLEFGQLDAAQSTLKRMESQLKEGNLDPQKIEQLLAEVSESISPAGQYGRASELMKKAVEKRASGENEDAAQALSAAADELRNLMRQMGDAQALLASLQALQEAQMSIGNGQSWSSSRSTPRAGQGGGVGSGVGTWADDNRWMDISDIRDRWDNSGVVRPDEDARGLTDRGDAQLADSLAPTKVKGQMTPGGPMPSITLKGVSIKGMSKVDFQEMAATAQSDAQSAISQEQVPRAYRGAVRDYFDDLKQ